MAGCGVEPGDRCSYCAKAGLTTCTPKVAEPVKAFAKPLDKAIRKVKNK